jgi:hypothetical protein
MKTAGWFFAAVALTALALGAAGQAQQAGMSFFVTSEGIGKGADLGGLDGRAFPSGDDKTCHNWTSGTQGTAIVGHIGRQGIGATRRRIHGIRHTPRAGPTAAAARRICAAPAALACSTASRRIDGRLGRRP